MREKLFYFLHASGIAITPDPTGSEVDSLQLLFLASLHVLFSR
jgi:hypothetical protein